jgi:hypothetical protein
MIAVGITNKLSELPYDEADSLCGLWHEDEFDIEVGREYTVYGLLFSEGLLWYLVDLNEKYWPVMQYPMFVPHFAFRVVDAQVEQSWLVDVRSKTDGGVDCFIWPPEFVSNPGLYHQMVDSIDQAKRSWIEMRAKYNKSKR